MLYRRPMPFFAWCRAKCERMDLTPSSTLAKAIAYPNRYNVSFTSLERGE